MSELPRGFCEASEASTPIRLVQASDYDHWLKQLSLDNKAWLARQKFTGKPGQFAWLSDPSEVVVAWDGTPGPASLGGLPMALPEGRYHLSEPADELVTLGWGMGAYQFDRYLTPKRLPAELVLTDQQKSRITHLVEAISLSRDLINTPAADMAPSNLMAEVAALADQFDASCEITVGDALLDRNCGAIHAVGRAAEDPPSLAELSWGDPAHPHVAIIGKGVTFDSGGLDLKPASGMRLMKKDMGGAAIAIGLAYAIMAERLPVRLSLLIPAAENAISGNAFRPGDVLLTHKGLTVEIDNTDAEGRLLLCDALSIASESAPQLMIDFATLTGSARSAVGAEISAMFSNSNAVAAGIADEADRLSDPVWRMPLHDGYNYMIESKVADLVNSAASPYAGAVTAALFLKHFVGDIDWVHFDIMAFNTRNRPGHPEGGEAMGLRAVLAYLEETHGTAQ